MTATEPRFIYAVECEEEHLQAALDLMRVLANPDARRRAHLTLKGPYSQPLSEELVDHADRVLRGSRIAVERADTFFTSGQGTVFLRCEATSSLMAVWDKPQFKRAQPHITIYDGELNEYAQMIFDRALSSVSRFSFRPTDLKLIEVGVYDPQQGPHYALRTEVAHSTVGALTSDELRSLSADRRCLYLREVAAQIRLLQAAP
jgi:hypothetical protein